MSAMLFQATYHERAEVLRAHIDELDEDHPALPELERLLSEITAQMETALC